jgi:glycosyltransferase involved in cell wall biosynthesis
MAPLIFWKAARIISVSSDILPLLRRETGKGIDVLPNGIDLGLFSPKSAYTSAKCVCYVGRLDSDKGVFDMLSCTRFPLLFIGPDEDGNREKLAGRAKRRGVEAEFIQVPYQKMPSAYGRCRYVVLPSKYEGFPLTLLESIAMGRPFVSTDVGQVKEVMGRLGLSPEKFILGHSIDEKIASLERKNMKKELAAARRKLEAYSWKKVAQKTAGIYRAALQG